MDLYEIIARMEEIREEIKMRTEEALKLTREATSIEHHIYRRSEAYWYPHIMNALGEDTHYQGSLQLTIGQLIELEEEVSSC